MRRRLFLWSCSIAVLACLPNTARAGDLAIGPIVPLVTGGEEVETCGWPDTVAVTGGGGLCTGSLVHPQVVVYAAHCGDGDKAIRFNESSDSGISRQAQCTVNPEYLGVTDQAADWAFCVLEEPITEIPFTPPLFGCELDMIEAGLPVVIAGFGDGGPDGNAGTKRWGLTEIVSTLGGTANIGGDGLSTCQGDSGGSAFVEMPDGTWRALSMTSTGLIGCTGTTGVHALMHPAIPWIEENSGIDITPCHDLDGTWNPTPNCSGFFAGGATGFGTWENWCEGTPRSGASESCGAAFDAEPDETPPQVSISSPSDGEEIDSGTPVTIAIDAIDDGYGIREVWVEIDGQEQPVRDGYPPYAFANVPFPDGVYEIVAYAEDWAGLVSSSAPVTIGVGEPVPDGPSDTSGGVDPDTSGGSGTSPEPMTSGNDTSSEGDGSSGPGATDGPGTSGCSCSADRQATDLGWLAWLFPVALTHGARRRRAHCR